MSKRFLFFLVTAGVVGIFALGFAVRGLLAGVGRPERAAPSVDPSVDAIAEQRLDRMERELGRLRGDLLAAHAREAATTRAPGAAAPADPPTASAHAGGALPDLSIAEMEALERQRAAAIGQAQRAEARDATWAPPLEAKLRQAFGSGALKGASLLNVECRATLCSIEATVPSEEQWENLRRGLMDSASDMLPRLTFHREPDGRGGFRVTTFGARVGSRFPRTAM